MRYFLLIFILLFSCKDSFANQSCRYVSTKEGITIISISPCYDKAAIQKEQDEFLNFFIKHIHKHNKNLNIVILAGPFGVYRPLKDFITVAFDTLSKSDTVIIDTPKVKYDHYPTYNYSYPRDTLNSIYVDTKNALGLKIRFYGEFDTTKDYYDRIINLVNYSIDNLEQIKSHQRNILMPYLGWDGRMGKISILTFDTSILNAINIKSYGFNKNASNRNINLYLLISVFVIAVVISIIVFARRNNYANKSVTK